MGSGLGQEIRSSGVFLCFGKLSEPFWKDHGDRSSQAVVFLFSASGC